MFPPIYVKLPSRASTSFLPSSSSSPTRFPVPEWRKGAICFFTLFVPYLSLL